MHVEVQKLEWLTFLKCDDCGKIVEQQVLKKKINPNFMPKESYSHLGDWRCSSSVRVPALPWVQTVVPPSKKISLGLEVWLKP
jgi:hypothetical protein